MSVLLVLFLALVMGDGFPSDEDIPATFSSNRVVGDIYPQGADHPSQRLVDTVVGAGLFTTNSDPNVVGVDPLTGEDAPTGTDVGFGAAVRRYIQTGVLNGDFAIPPPDITQAISDSNPLPYWTWEPNVDGLVDAQLVESTDAAAGYVLRVTRSDSSTSGTSTLSQFVPIPRSKGQQYRAMLSLYLLTSTGLAGSIGVSYQFYEADASTAIGSAVSANSATATGEEVKLDAGLVPANGSWVKVSVVSTSNSFANVSDIYEVRAAFLPAEATLGLASITAANTVTNSQERVVGITIPAGSFTVGSTYRITAYGVASNSSGSAQALTLRVRVGTTTLTGNIAGSRAPDINNGASSDGFKVEFLFTIRSVGGSGSAIANGETIGGPSNPLNTNAFVSGTTSTVAVDTTVANVLELTAVTANASASATFHHALIECVMAS